MEVRLGNIFGFSGGNYAGNVYDKDFIAPTLNTMQGGCKQPMIIANINPSGNGINGAVHTVDAEAPTITTNKGEGSKIIVAMRGRNPENPSDRTLGTPTEQRLEPNNQGLCNTLTSVQKDNLVMEKVVIDDTYANRQPRVYEEYFPALRSEREGLKTIENVYDFYNNNLKSDGVCGTLTSACSHNGSGTFGVIEPQYRIRKLTPHECWRLMDFSDEDFEKAAQVNSNTQLYKQAGNSIVRNVLVAIIGQMISGKENVYRCQSETKNLNPRCRA